MSPVAPPESPAFALCDFGELDLSSRNTAGRLDFPLSEDTDEYIPYILNVLGRELAKYGVKDKQVSSEREHVWSGIALKGEESGEE